MIGVSPPSAPGTDRQPGMTLAHLMQNNPALMPPHQPQTPSLASYLRTPLTNEPLQKPVMPDPSAGFVDMAPLPGVKPKGRGTVRDIVGTILDVLAAAGGAKPQYWSGIREQQQLETQGRQRLEEQMAERKARLTEIQQRAQIDASKPDYFTVGRNRVRFDPTSGQSQTIYEAPADFEEYAGVLGLQPGTDEYNEAVQDYVLRANGPTAQDGRESLESVRQDNRVSLEGVRQGNRVALRGMPTYANLHPRASAARSGGSSSGGAPRTTGNVYAPILAKIAAGKGLTPGEQQVIGMYGRGGRGGRAGGTSQPRSAGPVATDGKGNKVQWNGKAWVPVR